MRLVSYLKGYVSLLVEGKALERFVNLAVSRGIRFWDITFLDKDKIILRVRLSSVGSLRHIARRTASRFRVMEKAGLPFWVWRARRRKALYGGALFFFAVLCVLSSFVWAVEVSGTKQTDAAAIRRAAAEAGLKAGIPRWRVREQEVEQAIRERFPSLAWVGVDLKGTKASITVVEKKLPSIVAGSPAHIVARKAGLVKELLVLAGQPLVSEGDTVTQGQVLISGEVVPGQEGEPGVAPGLPRYVRAKGIVRARVWYQGYGEAPLRERGERTGRTSQVLTVGVGDHRLRIYGPHKSPYRRYRTRVTMKRPLRWRSFSAPVEVIYTEYIELVPYEIRHNRADARRLAEKRARVAVKASRSQQGLLLRENVEEVRTTRPEDIVRVRLRVEVLEDIGVVREFKPGKENGFT